MYTNPALESMINEYGNQSQKHVMQHVYPHILSYKDLCIFRKAFIDNRVCRHINYCGSFGSSDDANGHDIEQINLSTLHTYGIVTIGGQCNSSKVIESMVKADNGAMFLEEQRGFLDFYIPKDDPKTGELIDKLFADERIFTIVHVGEEGVQHNCPTDVDREQGHNIFKHRINVTRYTPVDKDNTVEQSDGSSHPTNVSYGLYPFEDRDFYRMKVKCEADEALRTCVRTTLFVSMICKEYNAAQNTSDILLEHVSEVGIERII
jgi:hypothetical protein